MQLGFLMMVFKEQWVIFSLGFGSVKSVDTFFALYCHMQGFQSEMSWLNKRQNHVKSFVFEECFTSYTHRSFHTLTKGTKKALESFLFCITISWYASVMPICQHTKTRCCSTHQVAKNRIGKYNNGFFYFFMFDNVVSFLLHSLFQG